MDRENRTLEALDWPCVVEALAGCARTARGREAALAVTLSTDARAIEAAFDAIDEVHALVSRGAGTPPAGGVEDIRDELVRTARGEVLDLAAVAAVRSTLGALGALGAFLATNAASAPVLSRLGSPIAPDRRLCRAFEAALDEHGRLSEATYPVLGELRRRIEGLERRMRSTIEALLDSPEYADVLQDRYVSVRGDRLVLPVKAQSKGLGLGIVHDASRTERTVFVEPAAVVPIGNERRIAEAELRDEERRILAALSSSLGAEAARLAASLEAACAVDLALARADFASRLGAVRPEVGEDDVIDLRAGRHAVLALGGEAVVANDLRLDDINPVLVLTGPNAGGKTVAMKTLGLAALLVRAGCFVPAAPGSRVDVFGDVLADIGDMQTVHEGLSSFSAHLTTLKEMLARAGRGSLLLLDEIAAGTDPTQGGALARAVIERLADVGARVVVTTHYTQVKAMAADDARVAVAALEYRGGRPTYRVVAGAVGESHALAAAERVGLDAGLLDRARELMEGGERALHDALAALEQERARVDEAMRRAEQSQREAAARVERLEAREQAIRLRARELEKKEAEGALGRLRQAEEEVRLALAGLRAAPDEKAAREARAAIGRGKGVAAEVAEPRRSEARPATVGDRVRIRALGAVGEVVSANPSGLEVLAGAMTVRVALDAVDVLGGPPPKGGQPAPRRGSPRPASGQPAPDPGDWVDRALRSESNTVDLRGMRVDEGLERLAGFLDEAMLAGREAVFVLHGHGTGAMKSAVRRHLQDSPWACAFAPAEEGQGGDGVTVVRLKG